MLRQRSLTALGTVAVALGLVLGAASPAAAHNYVVSSTPEEGATITAVPAAFTVTTNDVLLDLSGDGAGFGMVITDAAGLHYGDGCVTIDGRSLSTVAELGAAGDYTLAFQLISADGHTLSESISFRYEPSVGAPESEGTVTTPVCPGSGAAGDEPSAATAGAGMAEADVILLIVAVVGVLLVAGVVATVAVSARRRAR